MSEKPTYQLINLLGIADEKLYGLSGEVGISFELFPKKDLRMCASLELPSFAFGFGSALQLLPDRFGLTLEAEVVPLPEVSLLSESMDGVHPVLHEIMLEKQKFFSGRGRTIRYYAHLWSGGVNPLKLPLLPDFLPSKKKQKKMRVQLEENEMMAEEISQTFSTALSTIGVSCRRLGTEELIHRYWCWLNPSKSQRSSPPKIKPIYSLRSQLACANGMQLPEYLYLDGAYHSAVTFYDYPDEFSLGSIDYLLDVLPVGSRYIFNVLVPDHIEMLEWLKKKRKIAVSLYAGGEAKDYKEKDYESRERAKDLDAMIENCVSGKERVYSLWAGVILRTENKDDLFQWNKDLVQTMRSVFPGSQAMVEDLNHTRMFLASLPFSGHLSPRRVNMIGTSASVLSPLSRAWQGTESQGLLFCSPAKEPIFVDIFYGGTPRHGLIIGTTGSGKSFSANESLICLHCDPKVRSMVIDIGGSYKKLTEILGGAYFDIKLDEKYAINPMLPKNSLLREDGTMDPEMLGAQTSLIVKIAQASGGPARLVIEKAIERAYRTSDEPLLSDLYKVLKDESWEENLKPTTRHLLNELQPYVEGVYSLLLSRPSKIRPFENSITTFDLAGLKEHRALQSILVSVIAFSLNRQLADKSIRKVVIIDEAWEFFDDEQSAELISRLYRQARKQNAAIITISQSPVEFLNSKASTAIRANRDWAMALRMKDSHELLEKFGFTDQAIERAKTMQTAIRAYSEVLISFGNEPPRIGRIAPTSLEYWVATTAPEECAREEAFRRERGLTVLESLREMAKEQPVKEW